VPGAVAPRTEGDLEAMQAAYEAGLVFRGDIEAPTILLDAYLEPELDMHNSRQKFAIRQRMLDHDGDASNLVLWALDGDDDTAMAKLVLKGLELLEEWLERKAKSIEAEDACFDAGGRLMARGQNVWDSWEGVPLGHCAAFFRHYASPRIVAGEDLTGFTFKCHTKPVEVALRDGTYGIVHFNEEQRKRLRKIFGATGVCDYSLGDAARPANW